MDWFGELGEVGTAEPVTDAAADGGETFDGAGFDQKGVGAQVEGAVNVFLAQGRGQDDDGQSFEAGLGAQPFEDLKAIAHRHVEVQIHPRQPLAMW